MHFKCISLAHSRETPRTQVLSQAHFTKKYLLSFVPLFNKNALNMYANQPNNLPLNAGSPPVLRRLITHHNRLSSQLLRSLEVPPAATHHLFYIES